MTELVVPLLVLTAAVMHAVWNAVVKIGGDRLMALALVDGTSFVLCLAVVPFVAMPTGQVWTFLAASTAVNTVYRLFLVQAYNRGDLSQVYPIVRGIPPLFVALMSGAFVNETLSWQALLGVFLISAGIIS